METKLEEDTRRMHGLYNLFVLIHVSYVLESMREVISSIAIRRSVLVGSWLASPSPNQPSA
jgi:hypothetical protein